MKSMDTNRRIEQLRKLAETENAAILLTQQKNLSWLLGGRSHINLASEPGCCNVLVAGGKCVLIANNIEAKRLEEEEIPSDVWAGIDTVEVWSWFNPADRERLLRLHLAEGAPLKTDVELEARMLKLRSIIDDDRIGELKQIGRWTAEAIERAALDIHPGDSEYTIAGRLACQCYERGLDPIVNLIAVDERVFSRRHPLPTGKTLKSYAMLVVCARRNGLIASATRLVHIGTIPDEIAHRYKAVAEIETHMIDLTTQGKSLGELFASMKALYSEAGFPDEYTRHHQGGLTGFTTREKLSTPDETLLVEEGQLYAWNPSVSGAKSEDTMLVGTNGNEIITPVVAYPRFEINVGGKTYVRPGILQR
ncbi:M24 family metallopeptidase [Paenibacillus piri]|uniref:M24 family metallopeptidase n=1 Tax=Paenibacillus piri TaxID=2547395 RepID=A0A4R5KT54_9BACL|nr:M24 family metallopeptidase [Paenibacillus piri]TDF98057.1 M24 family metallopeptidase [Paenibacillus piri]